MNTNAKKTRSNSFSSIFSTVGFLIPWTVACTSFAAGVDLTPRQHHSSTIRVKTVVEVAGSLKVDGLEQEETVSIPLKVDGELFFDERGLPGDNFPSVRHYWEAKADFEVNDKQDHRQLRKARQVILLSKGSVTSDRYTSPLGPLSREELELVDVAGSGFPPERLLPNRSVSEKDSWKHDNEIVAQLLRLEKITDGEVTSKVTEIASAAVKIAISGEVTGEIDGVETKVEVKGNYHFDRGAKFVQWIALVIDEKRDTGFAAPGFDLVARVRSARQVIPKSDALNDRVIETLSLKATVSDRLLDFVSGDGFYRMSIDRKWYLLSDRNSSSVLRLVESGDLLATCKVDQLNRMVPGKQVTLDGFRGDVQKALGKNCKEIVTAAATVNPQGVRVLRVVAAGEVGETPIRWIYYHLSDDQGRRLSYIFTHESSLEDRLAGMDEALTNSVQFMPQFDRQARAQSTSERE